MSTPTYQAPAADWSFDLNDDELSYVLTVMGADTIPGLRANTLAQMGEQERECTVNLLKRSLVAKGYAGMPAKGEWQLEPTFANLIRLLIRPPYVFGMVARIGSGTLPDVTVCFAAPDVMLAQTFPFLYGHRFGVFFTIPDYAQDIWRMLPKPEGDVPTGMCTLSKASVGSLLNNRGLGDGSAFGQHNGHQAEHSVCLDAARAIVAQAEISITLTLSSLLTEEVETKELSIVASARGCVVLSDNNAANADGEIEIELASPTRLAELLQVWVAPLQTVNALA